MFPLDIDDYEKMEDRFQMQVNVFGYEYNVYPLYISKRSYNQTLNLLLITEKDKLHNAFIKDFNRLMLSRLMQKILLHVLFTNFATEEILSNHKKQCLLIYGCQGIIKFPNSNKQIPILFKIYADTECFLKRTKIKEGEHLTKYQEHQRNSIGAKLVCIDDRFTFYPI